MKTFSSIRKKLDRLDLQMREYIQSRYDEREGNPHLQRIFLLHGEGRMLRDLDTMPTSSLLNLCTAFDNAERKTRDQAATTRSKAAEDKSRARESVVIYTDGGYSNLHGIGAGAYVILKGGHLLKKGGDRLSGAIGNASELTAILLALKAAPTNAVIEIRSDSQYAIGVLTGWKAKKNLELIRDIGELSEKKHLTVSYTWVKGHNGDKYNEMCNRMCDQISGMDLNIEYEKYQKQSCKRKTKTKTAA